MRRKLAVLAIVLFALSGCAAWDLMTPDEKARTVVDTLQLEVERMFDESKAYVGLHPEHMDHWKTQVVPAFDLANQALKEVSELAAMEVITPAEVRARVVPFINDLVMYLAEMGLFD